MSLSALKNAILSEAQAQAATIADEAAARVRAEQEKTTADLRILEENIVAQAREEGERQARAIHQKAELAGRATILRAKQEELDATKQAFIAYLLALDASASRALHTALIAMLPTTAGEITAGEKSAAILKDIVSDKHSLTKETLKDEGGFIFHGKNVEMNMTFSYLVDHMLWKHRAEIAQELFQS